MTEQKFVYVDVDYLKELEETAKKVDYYKGIMDGIMMCKDEPQTHDIRTNTHECVKDTHDKTESNSEKPNNSTGYNLSPVEDESQTADVCTWDGKVGEIEIHNILYEPTYNEDDGSM